MVHGKDPPREDEADGPCDEYRQLHAGLDRQAIIAFAQHRSAVYGNAADKLIHLSAVADLASRYADILHAEADFAFKRYRRQVCEAAGFLHETLLQGCYFEDLIDKSDEAVARLVADVTPDVRAPGPRRSRLLANQLGLAGAEAQLLKLADIRHECLCYSRSPAANPPQVRIWAADSVEALACMHHLRTTRLLGRVQRVKREVLDLDRQTRACCKKEKA